VSAANAQLVGLDVAFTVDVTVTGWNTWHSTGTGETAPGVLALDMPGMQLQPHWLYAGTGMRIVLVGADLYVGEASLSEKAVAKLRAAGADWLQERLAGPVAETLGLEAIVGHARPYTPGWLLTSMTASTDVHAVGPEKINGRSVTRYDGTATLDDIVARADFDGDKGRAAADFFRVARADRTSFSLWLDASGDVVRIEYHLASPDGDLRLVESVMTGKGVSAPPADRVLVDQLYEPPR
jgi:hypothetical protein